MGQMTSILQRGVPGLYLAGQTDISFRVTKFGTKLSYSLYLQKYISLFDNHLIRSLHNLKCKGRLPLPQKYQILTTAQKMAYGGQYLFFNFCITPIELKLNA